MKRFENSINAGSMADIAFLLLIFFLVTTTIDVDKGITVKLPPWTEEEVIHHPPAKNVFGVLVNKQDQLLVRGEFLPIAQLKERAVEFILNPKERGDMPDNPKKAIISLKNDRETSYKTYISVYNELKAAYNSIWAEEALKRYGQDYEGLTTAEKKAIRKDIPLVISEAEPSSF